MEDKVTVNTLSEMKKRKKKITMLTAYDFATAQMIDQAGVDIILVGDSLGMVVLGYDNTLPVTMDEMIHHTKPVARAVKRAMVIGDMPFMSYQISIEDALFNAGRFLKEAGAHAVKLEGGEEMAETIEEIIKIGIPVQGHLGLTPQSIHAFGGLKARGKSIEQAKKLIVDAKILDEIGVFSIVLECVPAKLARIITRQVSCPTIGIGAGVDCDGQVLVTQDLLGMFPKFVPKFVKQYVNLSKDIEKALKNYVKEVQKAAFPGEEHTYSIDDEIIKELEKIFK